MGSERGEEVKRKNGMKTESERRQREKGYSGCFIVTVTASLHAMQSTLY